MLGVDDLKTTEAVAAAESAISTCQPVIPLLMVVKQIWRMVVLMMTVWMMK